MVSASTNFLSVAKDLLAAVDCGDSVSASESADPPRELDKEEEAVPAFTSTEAFSLCFEAGEVGGADDARGTIGLFVDTDSSYFVATPALGEDVMCRWICVLSASLGMRTSMGR